MDLDMHYYGTYALARAAGLKREVAETIAYASQYVDDSTDKNIGDHPEGIRFLAEVTAHHPENLPANRSEDDQRQVWVPFHFLPGGAGKTLSEKLVCQKDSVTARTMVAHHLERAEAPFAVELMGITAHVYADTFSHYGFSGVSSRLNRVVGERITLDSLTDAIRDYLGPRVLKFFEKHGMQGGLLENFRTIFSMGVQLASGALGHGAVAVYPDQPYLKWAFEYEFESEVRAKVSLRNNPATFLEACERLHGLFRQFGARRPELKEPQAGRRWEVIEGPCRELLAVEGDIPTRSAAWNQAIKDGILCTPQPEGIPEYASSKWNSARLGLKNVLDMRLARDSQLYHFYQACSLHRHYVLRELLPAHDIVVI